MFNANGRTHIDDSLSMGLCQHGGLWVQVIEGNDPDGRGSYIEISNQDYRGMVEALVAGVMQNQINDTVQTAVRNGGFDLIQSGCACGGNCGCK